MLDPRSGFTRGLLKLHKQRQRDGLWCVEGCPFHRTKTPKDHWSTHTGGWTFMVLDNIDRLTKEGAW